MKHLLSRKLVGAVVAMLNITGVTLLLAVITPDSIDTKAVIIVVTALAGLGGYHVARQARIDDKEIK